MDAYIWANGKCSAFNTSSLNAWRRCNSRVGNLCLVYRNNKWKRTINCHPTNRQIAFHIVNSLSLSNRMACISVQNVCASEMHLSNASPRIILNQGEHSEPRCGVDTHFSSFISFITVLWITSFFL